MLRDDHGERDVFAKCAQCRAGVAGPDCTACNGRKGWLVVREDAARSGAILEAVGMVQWIGGTMEAPVGPLEYLELPAMYIRARQLVGPILLKDQEDRAARKHGR